MSVVVQIIVIGIIAALLWWVARWKWPVPATITGTVTSVQEEEDQYSLQLAVEKVEIPEPPGLIEKWLAPYANRRLPKAGQNYTFRVPRKKMRARLVAKDRVAITGRVLSPLTGGVPDLSIHGATSARE